MGNSLDLWTFRAFSLDMEKRAGLAATLGGAGLGALGGAMAARPENRLGGALLGGLGGAALGGFGGAALRSGRMIGGPAGMASGRGIVGMGRNIKEIGRRIRHPVQGAKKGLQIFSPRGQIDVARGRIGPNMVVTPKDLKRAQALEEATLKTIDAQGQPGVRAWLQRRFGAGEHLSVDPNTGRMVAPTGLAERLSQAGWTGAGRHTKYLPFGDKGQHALGTAAFLPLSYGAIRRGEMGVGEEAGANLGFLGTAALTAGTGGAGLLGSMAASHYAGKLGRALDARRRMQGTTPGQLPSGAGRR